MARQELTLVELARELAGSPSVVRRWRRLSTKGSAAAVGASEEVLPASELRAAQQRIKELERRWGRRPWRLRFFRPCGTRKKEDPATTACVRDDGAEGGADLPDIGISRACAYRESVGRPARYVRADDRAVTAQGADYENS